MMNLQGLRLLIVEDEYIVAEELRRRLDEAGARVLGPVPSVAAALALVGRDDVDGAVLDVNLGAEHAFTLADELVRRHLPFVFLTGYTRVNLPSRFSRVPLLEKPMDLDSLADALSRARDGAQG